MLVVDVYGVCQRESSSPETCRSRLTLTHQASLPLALATHRSTPTPRAWAPNSLLPPGDLAALHFLLTTPEKHTALMLTEHSRLGCIFKVFEPPRTGSPTAPIRRCALLHSGAPRTPQRPWPPSRQAYILDGRHPHVKDGCARRAFDAGDPVCAACFGVDHPLNVSARPAFARGPDERCCVRPRRAERVAAARRDVLPSSPAGRTCMISVQRAARAARVTLCRCVDVEVVDVH